MAALRPPPGRTFVGFFYYVDDSYNYLSFVQQAEDGALLFRNKQTVPARPPTLLNLEWWLVGRISAFLGRHPALAYRIFGLAAALALLAAADRWLVLAGLPHAHRLPALVLVSIGGGLGGPLLALGLRPLARSPDLYAGLYPFLEMLANPHFVAGTALLLWTLWAYRHARDLRGYAVATALATVLGLVRPYDVATVALVHGAAVLATEPARAWASRILPLLGLVPVVAYDAWLFFGSSDFAIFSSRVFQFPPRSDFFWALGPAAVLAATCLARRAPDRDAHGATVYLAAWAAVGAVILAARPFSFSFQFLVGIGLPLLALGSLGLSRFPPAATLAAAAAFSFSSLMVLRMVLAENSYWFVPSERLEVARALRPSCRPGDLLLSPPDIGLYAGGLTACGAYLAHPAAAGFEERAAEVDDFYARHDPAARSALLDGRCLTHVILPGGGPDVPAAWLGPATPFRRVASAGRGPSAIDAFARMDSPACVPPRAPLSIRDQ